MVINKSSGLISTICLFTIFHTVLSLELVPVFMWMSPKSSEIVPAITQVNKATFTEIIFDKIEKSNPQIIVFAERNLSPEDFRNQHKKPFKEISLLSANNRLTYLPLVEDPIETIKDLPETDFAEVSITDISSAKDIPKNKVVIISLDDAKDDEDRTDMLRRHDAIVSKLYNELEKSNSKILVLFTGFHSSWIMPDQIKNRRQSRSVKADEDSRIFLNNSRFAIFVNGSITLTSGEEKKSIVLESLKKDENNGGFSVTTNDGTISFIISMNLGYWYLENITMESDTFMAKNIYAPRGFSYHCSKAIFETENATKIMEIPEFQIQYSENNSSETLDLFGDAYDCVGFTTAPIWSGLFITLILALIMTLGLTMMMDIKTMDRFDDPKGKTIIINASE